ncbi:hypothetical protein LCGC14_1903350 [marine sediment metagenome]|uniref:Uncharacterized protein n=1 Tax=marine sediment metagenome TaxID=412755 RepID=A0A0F9ITY4_9ZZZZ
MTEHLVMAQLGDRLRAAGIPAEQIWELGPDYDLSGNGNSWKMNEQAVAGNGQSSRGYYWTDENDNHHRFEGRPLWHLLHHTAGSAYTPNVKNSRGQTKCNCYAGLRRGNRLYQDGGGVPTLALASAGPSDYSAGSGVRSLIPDFIIPGIRFVGKQTKSDDSPYWYGNRYYWSTEVVLNGVGAVLDADVRELLIVYCAVISDVLDKNENFHGGHGQHTKRKIDLWDGRYDNMAETIFVIQDDVRQWSGTPPIEPPDPPDQGDLVQIGRNQQYVRQDETGQDVEYWQVRCIEAIEGVKFYGNSNKQFIIAEAPQLTWKVWNQAMTDWLSAWTRRNSYGIGATERIMVENAVNALYG